VGINVSEEYTASNIYKNLYVVFIIKKEMKICETSPPRELKSHILNPFHAYVNSSGFEHRFSNSVGQIAIKLLIADFWELNSSGKDDIFANVGTHFLGHVAR
jgi:hypothetical protein